MIKNLRTSLLVFILLTPYQAMCMESEEETNVDQKKTFIIKKNLPMKAKNLFKEGKKKEKIQPKIEEDIMIEKLKIKEDIEETDIKLKAGKGSSTTGGGLGGHYWKIFCREHLAGKVYINLIDEEPIGKHPSLQIYLNKRSQNKGIGRIGYRLACEASQYDVVYAHMSKKNVPSIKAARAAGFVPAFTNVSKQMIMKWIRKKKIF